MGRRFPAMKGRDLEKLIIDVCGPATRQSGSHRQYRAVDDPGRVFTFAYRAGDEITGHQVRRILTRDVGLTVEQASGRVGM